MLAFSVALVTFALPCTLAHLTLLPGLPATVIALGGTGILGERSWQNALGTHERALRRLDSGRLRSRYGALLVARAYNDPALLPDERLRFVERGLTELGRGLSAEPANSGGWTAYALGWAALDRHRNAAVALTMAWRTDPMAPEDVFTRLKLAFRAWRWLDGTVRAAVARDVARLARQRPRELAAFADSPALRRRILLLLHGDEEALRRFTGARERS